jgi:HK97 gp10 family phage protein
MYSKACPRGVTVSDIAKQAADLAAKFAKKGVELTTQLDIGMEAASLFVDAAAKKLSPVDLGLLSGSISHRVVKSIGQTIGQIGTNVEYAPYQELGTSKMEAANGGRGFLRPALDDNKATVLKIISDRIKEPLK